MDRRKALERTSWIIGAGVLTPSIIAFLQGCGDSDIPENGKPVALSEFEFSLLGILSDIIIPRTESVSATEANVPEFIDLLLADILDSDVSVRTREGLQEMNALCREKYSESFTDLKGEKQVAFIQKLDNEAFGLVDNTDFGDGIRSKYKSIKGLILTAYYTSEKGVTGNLDYAPVPGVFQSCIDVSDDSRITLGNHM